MQPARRLALVAALAVAGGLALAGCRSQPQVAAYVGDRQYTNRDVEAYLTELKGLNLAAGNTRQVILSSLVVRDVGGRVAADQKLSVAPADVAGTANALQLPSDSRVSRLLAEANAVVQTLSEQAAPVQPTEADQREVFAGLTYQGQLVSKFQKFESIRALLGQEQIGRGLAVRGLLNDAIAKYHVTVNPRYAPLQYLLKVSVADESGAVATSLVAIPLGARSVASARA
jgi:hypothetical protein